MLQEQNEAVFHNLWPWHAEANHATDCPIQCYLGPGNTLPWDPGLHLKFSLESPDRDVPIYKVGRGMGVWHPGGIHLFSLNRHVSPRELGIVDREGWGQAESCSSRDDPWLGRPGVWDPGGIVSFGLSKTAHI